MAKKLIDSLSTDFDAEKYRDEYREELVSLIERKARGEEIVESVSEEPKPTKAPDLMAALEESLAAVKGEPLAAGAKGDGGTKRRSRAKAGSSPRAKSGSSSRGKAGPRANSKSSSRSKSSRSKSQSRSKAKAAK